MKANRLAQTSQPQKMEFEEIRYLDKAITGCRELRADLLISLLKVRILREKLNMHDELAAHTFTFLEPIEDAGGDDGDKQPLSLDSEDVAEEVGAMRSIRQINQFNNNLTIQAIKIRRDVEEVLTNVERLRSKYVDRQQVKYGGSKLRPKSVFKLESVGGNRHAQCFYPKQQNS